MDGCVGDCVDARRFARRRCSGSSRPRRSCPPRAGRRSRLATGGEVIFTPAPRPMCTSFVLLHTKQTNRGPEMTPPPTVTPTAEEEDGVGVGEGRVADVPVIEEGGPSLVDCNICVVVVWWY